MSKDILSCLVNKLYSLRFRANVSHLIKTVFSFSLELERVRRIEQTEQFGITLANIVQPLHLRALYAFSDKVVRFIYSRKLGFVHQIYHLNLKLLSVLSRIN